MKKLVLKFKNEYYKGLTKTGKVVTTKYPKKANKYRFSNICNNKKLDNSLDSLSILGVNLQDVQIKDYIIGIDLAKDDE